MDVHPLIKHEPDPDHPGWRTWIDWDRYIPVPVPAKKLLLEWAV